MGKFAELSASFKTIELALQEIGMAVNDIKESLGGQPDVPNEKPITLEQVRAVLAEKSRAGFTDKVRSLLEAHGAAKLSDIDPTEYPALLAEAEGLTDG